MSNSAVMIVAALYAHHLPYVRGVVRKLGVPDPDVDDVAQEVFCVLLHRPPAQTPVRGIRRWLYQTARRVVSNHRRGRQRAAARLRHVWEAPEGVCPEQAAMGRQAHRRLEREVAALPSSAQRLYRLSEVEELPGPELARRLELNPNTAYARVRALRRRLAQALLVLALVLAALLVSQAGCMVTPPPSSAISWAPPVPPAAPPSVTAAEAPDDGRRLALRGPALGLAVLARAR